MRGYKDIEERVWACLREMYSKTQPPLDIGDNLAQMCLALEADGHAPTDPDSHWYTEYYLPLSEYREIRERHLRNRFRGYKRAEFEKAMEYNLLMYGPTSVPL